MLIQSQESTCARRKKPVRMGNERFCSLFASVLRINVICTNTVYSIKERKMYTYRQSTIKSNSLLVYYLVGLLLGGIGVALILLFSILAVMDLLRGDLPPLPSSLASICFGMSSIFFCWSWRWCGVLGTIGTGNASNPVAWPRRKAILRSWLKSNPHPTLPRWYFQQPLR